ncbi:uncharacterized protein LOC134088864 isoform X2 [Sardina pilchardus]|uniref:uncharacterized protein LOC134082009 isoform X2 n=1 Tax=Sardina pilchardus TaxID=27697 RepID=UPI002E14481F
MDAGMLYKWTDEDVSRLINLRRSKERLFSGRRNAAQHGWEVILKEMGLDAVVSPARAGKKWENLKKTYKELKKPPTGVSTESGETTAGTWKWYSLMDEVMGDKPSISPPVLITSSGGDHFQVSAVASPEPRRAEAEAEAEEEEEATPRKRAGKRKVDPVLDFLERDAERAEERARRDEEREGRLLSILERLVEKL